MKKRALVAWFTLLAALLFARGASAAPEAHVLRIDPRAGMTDGQPVLTSVLELVQFNPLAEVVTARGCGAVRGDALLDCISAAVEEKGAIAKALPFPDANTNLLVRVEGGENPAKLLSKASWGSSGKDPLVGIAWLIALDASSAMGPRYNDAREVANQFIGAMAPNDIAKLIIFDDRMNTYMASTPWVPASKRDTLVTTLKTYDKNAPSSGSARPLSAQLKSITKAFADLGNTNTIQHIPMMQAMVILSNGAGRQDAGGAAPAAELMKQFFLKGRFPEENTAAPKTPLPVISVYFPNARGLTNDIYAQNDMQFMQDLATPEIGGFFDIVKTGQGTTKSKTILEIVRSRFNQMWVVKWKISCLAPTVEQSFRLLVRNVNPPVTPDASFKDVPIGVDPTQWPLDINLAQTKADAEANPVYPGGTFRVYGDFCWGGDKSRAEAYFVPAGTNPNQNVNRDDPEIAKKAMQHLVAQGMRGTSTDSSETMATFTVPDEERVLDGQGEAMVARVVIYDNRAKRASGVAAETVLTLKAGKKPLNLPIILGASGIGVVILLLVVVLMRGGGGGGGGGGRKRGNQPPPAPVVAGGGGPPPYGGAPPYGGGGYQPPGGYGASSMEPAGFGASAAPLVGAAYASALPPPAAPAFAPAPPAPAPAAFAPPAAAFAPFPSAPAPVAPAFAQVPLPPPDVGGGGGYPLASAGGAPVVQVRCPACSMLTMATPGQSSVCFSCGQPLPRNLPAEVPAVAEPPAFPLTGAMASALEPPPSPYAESDRIGAGATILGAAGQFAIREGVEVRVGRDPAQCPIMLSEPRVSGVHATLEFRSGQLFVRDEGSNNGTYVGGVRIPAGVYTPVPPAVALRFGPVEFSVRLN